MLAEIDIHLPAQPPILYSDNLGAKALACYLVFHDRTKYIELDVHFVRSLVADQKLEVRYVPKESQPADILNTHGLHVLEETNICNQLLLESPSVYLNTDPSSIKL